MKIKINSGTINQVINGETVHVNALGDAGGTAPADDRSPAAEPASLRAKLGQGRIEDVISDLASVDLPAEDSKQLVLIASKYSLLTRDRNNNLITAEAYENQLSRIISALVELINRV